MKNIHSILLVRSKAGQRRANLQGNQPLWEKFMSKFIPTRPVNSDITLAGRRVYADLSGAKTREERVAAWREATKVDETGSAAQLLEQNGINWRQYETAAAVREAGEKVRALSEHDLVVKHDLPLWWLVDSEGNTLGVNGLGQIAQAVKLMKKHGLSTAKLTENTAVDVIGVELPKLVQLKSEPMLKGRKARRAARKAAGGNNQPQSTQPRLSKSARKAARRAASEAKAEAARKATEAAKASAKAAKVPEDSQAKANAHAVDPFEPIVKDGVTLYRCNGVSENGKECTHRGNVERMYVAKFGNMKHRQQGKEVVEADLKKFAFCPDCAPSVFRAKENCQPLSNALFVVRRSAQRIADEAAYKAKQEAKAKAHAEAIATKATMREVVRDDDGVDQYLCATEWCLDRATADKMTMDTKAYIKSVTGRDKVVLTDLKNFKYCPKCAKRIFHGSTINRINLVTAKKIMAEERFTSKGGNGKPKKHIKVAEADRDDLQWAANQAGIKFVPAR
jgi:hypothetical protein